MSLIKETLQFVKSNKRLFIFPGIGAILIMGLLLIFLIPVWHVEAVFWKTGQIHLGPYFIAIIYLLVFFFFYHLIINFFSAAMTQVIQQIYQGKTAKLAEGYRAASHCLPSLFLWTLVNTTLGIFIRFIEAWTENWEKNGLVQKYLAGLYWSLATLLMTPVLVLEHKSLFLSIQRSGQLMRQTWGPSLRMKLGWGWWVLLLRVVAFIPLVIAYAIGNGTAIGIGAIVSVILHLGISVFGSACVSALITAFYFFATENKIAPASYQVASLQKAFRNV